MLDVQDHLVQTQYELQFVEHDLESSAQHYLARVSIEMAAASNNIAKGMTKLSLAATIMLPLSLIAGLFGMNVKVCKYYTFLLVKYSHTHTIYLFVGSRARQG